MANELDFGKDIPKKGGDYFRVKQKGDSIRFRIASKPSYVGKHFTQTTEMVDGQPKIKWNVSDCSRINDQRECEMCETFFAAKKEEKAAKEAGDETKAKNIANEARKWNVNISFYFPVLNRETKEAGILQTTFGVRNEINKKFEAGVKIFERDFVLKNTGSESPRDRYAIEVVDSSETAAFDEKETAEFAKALMLDLSNVGGNSSEDGEVKDVQVPDSTPSAEDINF